MKDKGCPQVKSGLSISLFFTIYGLGSDMSSDDVGFGCMRAKDVSGVKRFFNDNANGIRFLDF